MHFTPEQIFIVTGATSGIGRGVALLINKLGGSVVAIGRNNEKLELLRQEASLPASIFMECCDLEARADTLTKYVGQLKDKYGKFQGLVCCAGMGNIMPLRAVDLSLLYKIFLINHHVPILLARGFADKRNHTEHRPSVVFLASIAALHGTPGLTAYAGSKGALIASAQAMAKELAPAGIRVNCVSPSLIDTPMVSETAREFAKGKYPFGIGSVDDVAQMVIFLLSARSQWITGQNYVIDCGSL